MTLPTLRTQLNDGRSTGSVDCAVLGVINAGRVLSHGKVFAGIDAIDDYVRRIREVAGNMHDGLLMEGDVVEVYRSQWWESQFEREGLRPPRVEYRERISWSNLRARALRGAIIHLPVDYGRVNDGPAPSGSLSFRGDHSIIVPGAWMAGPRMLTHIGDSLYDGRTRWVNGRWFTYPRGWQTARLADYRLAAGAWGRNPPGAGWACAVFLNRR